MKRKNLIMIVLVIPAVLFLFHYVREMPSREAVATAVKDSSESRKVEKGNGASKGKSNPGGKQKQASDGAA